jgi:ParB-like chromosome segregation protein Spo0J
VSGTNNSPDKGEEDLLLRIPLSNLHPHPFNANSMSEERLGKLLANINAEDGRYPPLVVRTHPNDKDSYQLLDGHQRVEVLKRAGHHDALCFLWECDDATALRLVATLNRLEGAEVPTKRARLISELASIMPTNRLAELLPESSGQIGKLRDLLAVDHGRLLADLASAAERRDKSAPRQICFTVTHEEEVDIEAAIARVSASFKSSNRRGSALGFIARGYLEMTTNG